MKTPTQNTNTDELLHTLITLLQSNGTRCGTGDQISAIRAQR